MVQINPSTIFIIGGFQDGIVSEKTWIVDPTNNFKIKQGPPLKQNRYMHACGKMVINGKILIVVAGGLGNNINSTTSDSVELLDVFSRQEWIQGKQYYVSNLATNKNKFVLNGMLMD